ncbi:MAG TPA: AI-2E family transporter [Methylomirabilota bacterium]|nr:AI-2E family transporter [Methylomirabilota bacterium]
MCTVVHEMPDGRLRPFVYAGILAFVLFCLAIAKEVFIPIALAMLLTFVLAPVVRFVERRHVPHAAAVALTVVLAFSAIGGVGYVLALQASTLAADLPKYEGTIKQKIREVRRAGKGSPIEKAQSTVKEVIGELQKNDDAKARTPTPVVVEREAPAGLAGLRASLGGLVAALATAGLVIVLVIFMLIEEQRLLDRLVRLAGYRRTSLTTKILTDAGERISRYLLMQSSINAGFGLAIGVGLFCIGVPYALLFGVLAAMLRFIPYVGAWIAASLPLVMSLAVFDGWREPVSVVAVFAGVELVIYLIIEPFLIGHSAGVSPLALLITLAFWTWLWGPIGLIVGTPLTVCLVALGRHVPGMEFIVVLFGDEPVVSPDVALYQRLLKGDEDEAQRVLVEFVKTHDADAAYDEVLMPALCRMRTDAARGAISPDETRAITRAIDEILDDLDASVLPAATARDDGTPPAAPAVTGLRVVSCPARDEVDEAALRILASRLAVDGVAVTALPATLLVAEVVDRVGALAAGVAVVASLAPGGLAQSRHLVKRLRAVLPDLPIVAVRWGPPDGADEARQQLLAAGATEFAPSLLEARERILQYRQVRAEVTPSHAA